MDLSTLSIGERCGAVSPFVLGAAFVYSRLYRIRSADMNASFAKGDVVELKSGGPKMTVTNVKEDGQIVVQYFAGQYVKLGVFVPESLRLYKHQTPIMVV